MAEGTEMDVQLSGEFRGRQHSFHSVASYRQKACKRPAAKPLDFAQPQRQRLEEEFLSVSAPIHTLAFPIVRAFDSGYVPQTILDSDENVSDVTMEGEVSDITVNGTGSTELTISPDMTDSSSPSIGTPPGSPEEEDECGQPQRIVRPEDISLHNPDSGLGYRASRNDYHTDDSDDGHDDEDESEREEGVSDPEDLPPSHPCSPANGCVTASSSPSRVVSLEEASLRAKEAIQETLPYTTPLDLELTFDPTVHMGLLMIDPSHQERFNELYPREASSGFTSHESLLRQYEAVNAAPLLLNTELDEVDEVVEVIEEEDVPANPPSSPASFPTE